MRYFFSKRGQLVPILFMLVLFVAGEAFAQNPSQIVQPVQEYVPSLVQAVNVKGPLDFCGEPVPLDDRDVRERLEMELLLMTWDRAQTILWLKRAGRFFPHIEKSLKDAGMPDDLKYIAVIESSLRGHVGSNKGAVGFWQFIESTGTKFGLSIDSAKDERRNLVMSTTAALQYFRKLYSMFNSWTLSAAAYNMGENGLRNNIEAQDTNNYYYLFLPMETMRYVYRALAVKIIFTNPQRFGFVLTKDDLYPPIQYDRVTLNCPYKIHLLSVAKAAKTYYKTMRELNPELKTPFLDKGVHNINVPKGTGADIVARFDALLKEETDQFGLRRTYVVKKGESLTSIAKSLGVPTDTLMKWNGLSSMKPLNAGQRIIIYVKPEGVGADEQ